jgi:hypothetical protein
MENGWTVTLEVMHPKGRIGAKGYDRAIDNLVDHAAGHGGAVSHSSTRDRYSITLSMSDAPDARAALADAAGLVDLWAASSGLPEGTVVNAHVRTFAEHDAEIQAPLFPEVVGVAELAALLDVAPQRASALKDRNGFPPPIATLKSGPIWVRANVEHFARTWDRKPGRPRNVEKHLALEHPPAKAVKR